MHCDQCGALRSAEGRFCDSCGSDQGGGRSPTRVGLIVGVAVVVLAGAAGGGVALSRRGDASKTRATRATVAERVVASAGAEVASGGITLILPPGALSTDALVRVAQRATPSARPASPYMRALSPSYELDAAGASLVKPVEVAIAIDASAAHKDLPPEAFVLAFYDRAAKAWTGVDTTVDADRRTVRASTSHLSEWRAFAADLPALSNALSASASKSANAVAPAVSSQKCFPDTVALPDSPVKLMKVPENFSVEACVEGTATQTTLQVRMVNRYARPILVEYPDIGPIVVPEYLSGPKPPSAFEKALRDKLYPHDLLYMMPGESVSLRTTFPDQSGTVYFLVNTAIPAVISFFTEFPKIGEILRAVPCIAGYALAYRPSKTATISDYKPVVKAAVDCMWEIWLNFILGGSAKFKKLAEDKEWFDAGKLAAQLIPLAEGQAGGGYFQLVRVQPDPPVQPSQTTSPTTSGRSNPGTPPTASTTTSTTTTTAPPGGGTGGGRAPAAPTNLSVFAQCPDRFNLAWRDNSDNETEFRIYENGVFDRRTNANTPAAVIVFSQLAGSEHTYTVTARNQFGESAPSNAAYVSKDCRPVPAVPIYDSVRVEKGAPCPGPRPPGTSSGAPPGSCVIIHMFRYTADSLNGLQLVLYSDLHGREITVEVPGGYPACPDGTLCSGATGTFSYDQVPGQQVCFWFTAISGGGESGRSNTRCATY